MRFRTPLRCILRRKLLALIEGSRIALIDGTSRYNIIDQRPGI